MIFKHVKGGYQIKPWVFPIVIIGALFGAAGRWDLPFAWAYLFIFGFFSIVTRFTIDKGLFKERIKPGAGNKDHISLFLVFPLLIVHYIIAGLDIGRYHFSDVVPVALQIICLVGTALSLGLSAWAITINPFFSTAVRIQEDRGHKLITSGPYQYVRHPGYIGGILALTLGGLALGSLWSMLPIAGYIVVILRRTRLEDRFLQEELQGYKEYTQKVCYRLIPGIW